MKNIRQRFGLAPLESFGKDVINEAGQGDRLAPASTQSKPSKQSKQSTPKQAMTIKVRTLVILAALAAIGGGAFVYFGVYNVAATEQHTAPVYYILHYAMERSVRVRADDVKVPDLSDPSRVRRGFGIYRQHCVQCHGGPGVAPDPVGFGVRPEPLNLAGKASHEWRPAEIYWVIKHGVKPTAMPAWEYRLSDDELWDLTVFVKQLSFISPKEYMDWNDQTPAAKPVPIAANQSNPARLGDAKAGKHAMQQYLCITCHAIPGITGADKTIGPPLDGIATRKYIGGVLVNTPENMMRWLRDPQQIDPLSGMPNLHIRENDIRDIAAYLYTLNEVRK